MQHNRNPAGASPTPPASTAVVGLGVCDVLRVEARHRGSCRRFSRRSSSDRSTREAIRAARSTPRIRSRLAVSDASSRTLTSIAEQLRPLVDRLLIWGPAPMISDLVACAARGAVDRLDAVIQRERLTSRDRVVLLEAAHWRRRGRRDLYRDARGRGLQLRSRRRLRPTVTPVGPRGPLSGLNIEGCDWTPRHRRHRPARGRRATAATRMTSGALGAAESTPASWLHQARRQAHLGLRARQAARRHPPRRPQRAGTCASTSTHVPSGRAEARKPVRRSPRAVTPRTTQPDAD